VVRRDPETCPAASASFSPKAEILKATPLQTVFARRIVRENPEYTL
jgi:hypothetical protein